MKPIAKIYKLKGESPFKYYGVYRDGSKIYQDENGYYITALHHRRKTSYKKYGSYKKYIDAQTKEILAKRTMRQKKANKQKTMKKWFGII